MIESLQIKNFKSIRELAIPCRKLNIFIGEPNSGKSNVIEALALKSQNAFSADQLNKDIFRYKTVGDLFFDFNISNPIEVITDGMKTKLKYAVRPDNAPENQFSFILDETSGEEYTIKITHNGKLSNYPPTQSATQFRYYEFKRLSQFTHGYIPHLSVPFGDNLPGLLLANSEFKNWVSEFLRSKGLRLTLRPVESDIAVSKFVDEEIYSYPYLSISETLQRVIFYMMAIKSNQNAVLLFDEPESNTFPFYTKFIAERIALDESNQFFITTHNPYLLLSLIEKSPLEQVNVGLTEMDNYQTKITILNKKQIERLLDLNSDVFFNFSQIIS